MKRKRLEYDEDDKLLHQATKALTKEAKRVKTFLLQQALRKHRVLLAKNSEVESGGRGSDRASPDEGPVVEEEGSGGDARETDVFRPSQRSPAAPRPEPSTEHALDGVTTSSSLSRASTEVSLIKGMQPLSAVKICLRRLGLAHTGFEGEKEVEVEGSARLQELVGQVLAHERVTEVMDEFQERVTQRRRDKLAESEGRSPFRKVKGARAREGRNTAGFAPTTGNGGRQGRKKENRRFSSGGDVSLVPGFSGSASFVSLSGEGPLDDEWALASRSARKTSARAYIGGRRQEKGDSGASTTKTQAPRLHEPGWAGADREAGWGRGGGRARNGDRGKGKSRGRGRVTDTDKTKGGSEVRENSSGGRTKTAGGKEVRGDSGGVVENRAAPFSPSGGREGEDSTGTRGGEDLHGSWAAKRALKEKEASATKAFSGKKITFNDDDDD